MKENSKGSQRNIVSKKWQALKGSLYPYLAPVVKRWQKFAEKNPRKAKFFKITGGLFGAGLGAILLFLLMILVGIFGRMPSKEDLRNVNNAVASEVYSADSVLLGKYYIENRLPADLKDVSPNIINALIATEDARFYEHGGVDLRASFRVLFRTLLQGDDSAGGGSTLSQQLAKNLYPRKKLGPFTVPIAKIKEMFIARRLESVYDKNGLLALYLNTVSFSDNVFGIKVAAERFFDATPQNIKVEEAAVLVGMLKATSAYNPARHPKRSQERRNTVLAQMVKYNYLEQAVFDSLKQQPVRLKYKLTDHNDGMATYFRESLRLELEKELEKYSKPDGRPYNLYTDGLKIYTTLHSKMQTYAEEAVREQMKEVQKSFIGHFKGYANAVPWGTDELLTQQKQATERYQRLKERGLSEVVIDSIFNDTVDMVIFDWNADSTGYEKPVRMTPLDSLKYYMTMLNTGFLAADPKTGAVKAWVGGTNYKYFKYDHVKSLRQVGSTFKPVVYAEAIEDGVSPCERISNQFRAYPKFDNWSPRNADGKYGGSYSMRGGMRLSVNVAAVQLITRKDSVSVQAVMDLAKKMGITSKIPNEPGIALGSVDATLYEMVHLFSTFANRGIAPTLYYLNKIETQEGKPLGNFGPPNPASFPRVISEQTADMVRYLLQSVVDGGTGGRLRYREVCNFPYPAGGKTGTTNNNSDGWFLGFTPDLVFGAWVGAEQPQVRWYSTRVGQGGVTALPICGKFLVKVYEDEEFKHWQKNNFPNLTGPAAGAFNCSDYIGDYDVYRDSLYKLENLYRDSMPEEERQRLIEELKNYLRERGQLPEPDSTAVEAETLIDKAKNIFKKKDKDEPNDELTERGTRKSVKNTEESERVQKANEKLERKRERQKKRKETLDKIFGKGN